MQCSICASNNLVLLKSFSHLSPGETDLGIDDYYRELWLCQVCGHYLNIHDLDLKEIYSGEYWNKTYSVQSTEKRFHEVMSLPNKQSDNRRRVNLIQNFWHGISDKEKRLLDIGSGLGVFPAAMKEAGWYVAATDPDSRAIEQVKRLGNIDRGFVGTFPEVEIDGKYSLVTFNKVLEHVKNPIVMLSRASDYISDGGWLYVELPDGQSAYRDSPQRQEFFLEHYGAFSMASMTLLIEHSGFIIKTMERLVEPSGKYTLFAFARELKGN